MANHFNILDGSHQEKLRNQERRKNHILAIAAILVPSVISVIGLIIAYSQK